MNNRNVCHNFFYQSNEYFDKSYMTVSYNGDTFYSYYTAIAKKVTGKNGQEYLLISNNNMSATTGKHLSYLRHACPHNNVIWIPQDYGNHYIELDTIIKRLEDNIKYYANSKLTRKENRDGFTSNYYTLQRIENEIQETGTTILQEFETLYNDLNNPEKIKEIKEQQRKKDREKQAQLKKELETILNTYSYLDLIKYAFMPSYWLNDTSLEHYNKFKDLNKDLKTKLQKYFNPKNDLSFIWFEDDLCKTSQGIKVPRKEVEILLKLWKQGKAKQGMKIGIYTIIYIKDDFVKVGCHLIPTKNLNVLYDLMTEQKAA